MRQRPTCFPMFMRLADFLHNMCLVVPIPKLRRRLGSQFLNSFVEATFLWHGHTRGVSGSYPMDCRKLISAHGAKTHNIQRLMHPCAIRQDDLGRSRVADENRC